MLVFLHLSNSPHFKISAINLVTTILLLIAMMAKTTKTKTQFVINRAYSFRGSSLYIISFFAVGGLLKKSHCLLDYSRTLVRNTLLKAYEKTNNAVIFPVLDNMS